MTISSLKLQCLPSLRHEGNQLVPFSGWAPPVFHLALTRYKAVSRPFNNAEKNEKACLDSFFILLFVFRACSTLEIICPTPVFSVALLKESSSQARPPSIKVTVFTTQWSLLRWVLKVMGERTFTEPYCFHPADLKKGGQRDEARHGRRRSCVETV